MIYFEHHFSVYDDFSNDNFGEILNHYVNWTGTLPGSLQPDGTLGYRTHPSDSKTVDKFYIDLEKMINYKKEINPTYKGKYSKKPNDFIKQQYLIYLRECNIDKIIR